MQVTYASMIGDIADRTLGASKLDILNAVGFDSRVGKKCVYNTCRVLRARATAAVECDSWLQVPAPRLGLWRSLLPSRQTGAGRVRQVSGRESIAARSYRLVQEAAHALSNRRAAGSEQIRVRVHWYGLQGSLPRRNY